MSFLALLNACGDGNSSQTASTTSVETTANDNGSRTSKLESQLNELQQHLATANTTISADYNLISWATTSALSCQIMATDNAFTHTITGKQLAVGSIEHNLASATTVTIDCRGANSQQAAATIIIP